MRAEADADRTLITGVALTVLALDQVTKVALQGSLHLYERVALVPGVLDLTHVHNRGMAFGLFDDVAGGWLRWALVAVAVLAVVIIWSYARREPATTWLLAAFGCVLGGALGNLVDRLRLGYVVDFILVHWGAWQFPAFNVADSAITIGGICLFLDLAREAESDPGDEPEDEAAASSDDDPAPDAADPDLPAA